MKVKKKSYSTRFIRLKNTLVLCFSFHFFTLSPLATAMNSQPETPKSLCETTVTGEATSPSRFAQSYLNLIKKWIQEQNDVAQIEKLSLAISTSPIPLNPFLNSVVVTDIQLQSATEELLPYIGNEWNDIQNQIPDLVTQRIETKEAIDHVDSKTATPVGLQLIDTIKDENVFKFTSIQAFQLTDGAHYFQAEAFVKEDNSLKKQLQIFKVDPNSLQATLVIKVPLTVQEKKKTAKKKKKGEPIKENQISIWGPNIPIDEYRFLARKSEGSQNTIVEIDIRDGSITPQSEEPYGWPEKYILGGKNSAFFDMIQLQGLGIPKGIYHLDLQSKKTELITRVSSGTTTVDLIPEQNNILNIILTSKDSITVRRLNMMTREFLGDPATFELETGGFLARTRSYISPRGKIYIATFNDEGFVKLLEYSPDSNDFLDFKSKIPQMHACIFHKIYESADSDSFFILAKSTKLVPTATGTHRLDNHLEVLKFNTLDRSIEQVHTYDRDDTPLHEVKTLSNKNRELLLSDRDDGTTTLRELLPETGELLKMLQLNEQLLIGRQFEVFRQKDQGDFVASVSSDKSRIHIYKIFE